MVIHGILSHYIYFWRIQNLKMWLKLIQYKATFVILFCILWSFCFKFYDSLINSFKINYTFDFIQNVLTYNVPNNQVTSQFCLTVLLIFLWNPFCVKELFKRYTNMKFRKDVLFNNMYQMWTAKHWLIN